MSTPIAKPPTVDFLGVNVTKNTTIGNVFSFKKGLNGETTTGLESKAMLTGTAGGDGKISLRTNASTDPLQFSVTNQTLQQAEDAFKAWNYRLNENNFKFQLVKVVEPILTL